MLYVHPTACVCACVFAILRLCCVPGVSWGSSRPTRWVGLISKTRPPDPERVSIPTLGGTGDTPSGLTYDIFGLRVQPHFRESAADGPKAIPRLTTSRGLAEPTGLLKRNTTWNKGCL